MSVQVAIDVGPLHGRRTGIGVAVAGTVDALRDRPDGPVLRPYVVSTRAKVAAPTRRFPVPAALALRWWGRANRPRVDRFLGRPDLVHGTNYVVPPTRAPRLVSVYDCWFLEHPEDAVPDVRLAGRALRRAVDDGAHVVTSSGATNDAVVRLLGADPGRVTTVHLGPPDLEPAPDRPPRAVRALPDRYVLAVGTTERRKNLPTLVDAFARLAAEVHDVALVLAGADGDDTDAVTAAIGRLDDVAAGRIHRLGPVDGATKSWLLHHAAVLAYPSLDEGFGFPILEAQLAGVPIVASSVGSIPEVAGAGALLGLPRDRDALAANLYGALTSDRRRRDLVERGRANAERFSWDRTATDLISLYHRLVEAPR